MLLGCEPDLTLIAERANTNKLVEQVITHQPHIILLDWESANGDATCLISSIRQIEPSPHIIVLSSRSESELQALQAGADIFVNKTDPPDTLLGIIRALGKVDTVQRGESL
jgi:DNA-binding NarL/FixJ family response regulator